MSTEPTRRRARRRRSGRRFAITLVAVVAALALTSLAGAAATIVAGPRVTDVQVDPAAAAQTSGVRLIVTTSLPLEQVDQAQVRVEPEAAFAVDTAGRSVGVRFALPLWDDTEYTVSFTGLRGVGASNAVSFSESFRTPPAEVFLLQRGADDRSGDTNGDTIVRSNLAGTDSTDIFTHRHIEDFRATSRYLVISTRDESENTQLIVTDLDGTNPRALTLPGDGFVTQLQSADRGDRIGYIYTDRKLSATSGRESRLFTASLDQPDAAATPIEITGADPRIAEWSFVPDTDSILLLSFDGTLLLTDAEGADATALGDAVAIDGIARGSTEAIVQRIDNRAVIDLSDASEQELVTPDVDLGLIGTVTAVPDMAALPGSTIRVAAETDATGAPTGGTSVSLVQTSGATRPLVEVSPRDAVLHICVSPSARYAAVLVAPDAAANRYDTYALPMPATLETRIVQIDTGEQVGVLPGFDISWCTLAPA